jgi:DNA-directed RNA polymerase subunit F|tara:strand:- start:1454 stop:1798 length:345 start_codon:yes stop_codon:yes gene_type:complete
MTLEILSEKPISTAQLKEELKKIKQRDKELNFRATKTEDHLDSIETFKDIRPVFEKINKLNIPRLREQHIYKIIDTMPKTVKDLKVVMQGYTVSLNNENLKKIVDVINSFTEKK